MLLASVLLVDQVAEELFDAVPEEHRDVRRPDCPGLGEHPVSDVVEGLLAGGHSVWVELAPLEMGKEELGGRGGLQGRDG